MTYILTSSSDTTATYEMVSVYFYVILTYFIPDDLQRSHLMLSFVGFFNLENMQVMSVADLRGDRERRPRSKFFQFHAVFGKIWQNRILAPRPPPSRRPGDNPRSATGCYCFIVWSEFSTHHSQQGTSHSLNG